MFYSIANLVAQSAAPMEKPWEFRPTRAHDTFAGKDEFRAWCAEAGTRHSFISAVEGMAPLVRVSFDGGNPPFKMHGLVVDYDSPVSAEIIAKCQSRPQSEFLPEWFAETFSGNARLVWIFERPLLISTKAQIAAFAVIVRKKLSLSKWLAGLDTEALGDPCRYYEVGKNWQQLNPNARIPFDLLSLWLYEASKKLPLASGGPDYKIPLERIDQEVQARFPGRWTGPFEEGRRGVRFWDPSADNESAAIVRADGMQCFTGNEAFVSWRRIFGANFVEEFEADKISGILESVAYDGREFWVHDETTGRWVDTCKDDFGRRMRVKGFNPTKAKGQTCSEVDQVIDTVVLQRRVKAALPYMYQKPGIISVEGTSMLNISTITPMKAGPPVVGKVMTWADGRTHFPFIMKLLRHMFPEEQARNHFLAWFKYVYVNAALGEPRLGQALVFAGPPNKGKSLLTHKVIAPILGGAAMKAGDHMLDGDRFTAHLAESPIWFVDDEGGLGDDERTKQKYTARMKQYVTNALMTYEQKYKAAGQIPWPGRIIIACNLDLKSRRIIPDMDMATRDKLMLFKIGSGEFDFPDMYEIQRTLAEELPGFCRFLLEMEYPAGTLNPEKRFGVVSYHNGELLADTLNQGIQGTVIEMLHGLMEGHVMSHPGTQYWEGTLTALYSDLNTLHPGIMRTMSPQAFGSILATLSKNGHPVARSEGRGTRLWRVGVNVGQYTENANGATNGQQETPAGTPGIRAADPVGKDGNAGLDRPADSANPDSTRLAFDRVGRVEGDGRVVGEGLPDGAHAPGGEGKTQGGLEKAAGGGA